MFSEIKRKNFELIFIQTVGNLDAVISNFRAEYIKTSSVLLMWDPVPKINGYVLVVNDGINDEKTISIDGNYGVYMGMDLTAGSEYNFGSKFFSLLKVMRLIVNKLILAYHSHVLHYICF